MKRIFLSLILLILISACSSNKEKVENILMDCIYNSYDDNGNALKKAIYDYETLLIEQGFITDRTGKSYKSAFKAIQQSEGLKQKPSITFQGFISNIPSPNIESTIHCENILMDSTKYDYSTIRSIDKVMQKHITASDLKPETLAVDILSVLTEEDFEHDYHKMRLYTMLNLME